jgi:hypothetical protein
VAAQLRLGVEHATYEAQRAERRYRRCDSRRCAFPDALPGRMPDIHLLGRIRVVQCVAFFGFPCAVLGKRFCAIELFGGNSCCDGNYRMGLLGACGKAHSNFGLICAEHG